VATGSEIKDTGRWLERIEVLPVMQAGGPAMLKV
jgi:hypothetical protein